MIDLVSLNRRESPKILWERTDGTGVLPVGRFDSLAYDTNLKIRDLRVEDKGSYRCTGTNTAGNAQQMVYLDVKSLFAVVFIPVISCRF